MLGILLLVQPHTAFAQGTDYSATVTVEGADGLRLREWNSVTSEQRFTGQGQYYTKVTVTYTDLCSAPCTFEADPGLHTYTGYGKNQYLRPTDVHLSSGPNVLTIDPGNSLLRTGGFFVSIVGLASASVGTYLALAASDEHPRAAALPVALISVPVTIGAYVAYKKNPGHVAVTPPN